MREIGLGSLIKDLERNMYAKVVLFNKDETIDLRYENEDIQWLTKNKERFKVISNFRIGDRVIAKNQLTDKINGKEGIIVGFNKNSNNPLVKYKFKISSFHNGQGNELFHYESDKNDCWYVNEENLALIEKEKFNWKEFKASDKIAVHCKTEEEAIDFCKKMNERGLTWNDGTSYKEDTKWEIDEEETTYYSDGTHAGRGFAKRNEYKILEWIEYMGKEFTKADLKVGMVVKLRSENMAFVGTTERGIYLDWKDGARCFSIENYNDNLKVSSGKERNDIIEVYGYSTMGFNSTKISNENRQLLWKREEKTQREIKIEEIELTIENLKKQVEELKGE